MNHETIIEFYFNTTTEKQNQNFYFNYAWRKVWKSWVKITILAVIFLFLGFYPIENFDTNLWYYFFKYAGIFLAGYSFIIINQYFTSKKKFKIEIDKMIDKFSAKNEPHFLILNDESIEFKNPFNTIKSSWENTSYKIAGDYIIISPIKNIFYITHKSEVSEDQYKIMIQYLIRNSKEQK
ncbi:hypothetical protein GSF70_10945 [Flavobacteriaceae bacterium W22]|nr:hypothetical protein [Flavobacteriaceae bacterium W22]